MFALYSIQWLVFITETTSFYCAVRTGSLNITELYFVLKRLTDQVMILRLSFLIVFMHLFCCYFYIIFSVWRLKLGLQVCCMYFCRRYINYIFQSDTTQAYFQFLCVCYTFRPVRKPSSGISIQNSYTRRYDKI